MPDVSSDNRIQPASRPARSNRRRIRRKSNHRRISFPRAPFQIRAERCRHLFHLAPIMRTGAYLPPAQKNQIPILVLANAHRRIDFLRLEVGPFRLSNSFCPVNSFHTFRCGCSILKKGTVCSSSCVSAVRDSFELSAAISLCPRRRHEKSAHRRRFLVPRRNRKLRVVRQKLPVSFHCKRCIWNQNTKFLPLWVARPKRLDSRTAYQLDYLRRPVFRPRQSAAIN